MMSERLSMSKKQKPLEESARVADELWLRHKVNLLEKLHQLHTSPARVLPPWVPRWLAKPEKSAE